MSNIVTYKCSIRYFQPIGQSRKIQIIHTHKRSPTHTKREQGMSAQEIGRKLLKAAAKGDGDAVLAMLQVNMTVFMKYT